MKKKRNKQNENKLIDTDKRLVVTGREGVEEGEVGTGVNCAVTGALDFGRRARNSVYRCQIIMYT